MCAGSCRRQNKDFPVNAINQQPVGQDVTFSEACIIARQGVISVLGSKGFLRQQIVNHRLQQGSIKPAPFSQLIILAETRGCLEGQHSASSSANSSLAEE